MAVRPIARPSAASWGAALGQLPIVLAPTAEDARQARFRQLGAAGTYRVHNCGKILFVDYERGELVVERDGSYRG